MSLHLEPPPPGETGTELHGSKAAAALAAAIETRLSSRVKLAPVNVDTGRDGNWVVIIWRFPRGFSLTWKLSRHWARVLRAKLDEVL